MAARRTQRGFTLIELLISVAIIGIIAAIAIPSLLSSIERARIARMVGDIKTFEKGFLRFALDTDNFPPDSHLDPPYHLPNGVGIEAYLPVDAWFHETPFGGNYNWEGPDSYPYAGISLFASNTTVEQATRLDGILDDGDLATGSFRITTNGRYTYIIEE